MSKRAALCLCWLTVATSGTYVPAAQRSLDSEVRRQRGPVATIETFTLDLDPAVAAEIIEARAGRTARAARVRGRGAEPRDPRPGELHHHCGPGHRGRRDQDLAPDRPLRRPCAGPPAPA